MFVCLPYWYIQVMTADPGPVLIPDVSQSGFHSTTITPMQTCSLPVTNVALQQCPVSMPYMLPQPNPLAAINPATINLAAMNNPVIFPAAIDPSAVRTPVFSVPNVLPQIRTQLPVKRFQVEDVTEVESPNTSDVSAHSSTENLVRELSKSGSQDADMKVPVQILGPLESTSGSSISVEMEHLSFPQAEHLHFPHGIVEHPSIQRAATQMAEYPPLQVPPAEPCTCASQFQTKVVEPSAYLPSTLLNLPSTLQNLSADHSAHTWNHPMVPPATHQPIFPPSSTYKFLSPEHSVHPMHTWHHPTPALATHQPVFPLTMTSFDPSVQTARQHFTSVSYTNLPGNRLSARPSIPEARHSVSSLPSLQEPHFHHYQQKPERAEHTVESHVRSGEPQHPPASFPNKTNPATLPSQPLQEEAMLSNFPRADLLSKAFMSFLNAMSIVLRDPAIQALLQSSDQNQTSAGSNPPTPPYSSSLPTSPTQKKHTVSQVRTNF